MQLGETHRLHKAAARLEEIAIFPVTGGNVGTGEQQPLAIRALVLAVILEEALRNFLVMRIVAEPRRPQREPLHEKRTVFAAVEISLGPRHRLGRIERGERRLQLLDDLTPGEPAGSIRRADPARFEPAGAPLVPR